MDNDLSEGMRPHQKRRKRMDRHVTRLSTLARRGYGCIALDRPTDEVNVGHTLRAALCFEAQMVIIGGGPPDLNVRKLNTDPGRAYKHVPVLQVDDIFDAMPEDCTPVAVELTDDAVDLTTFVHPERACYVFGPENGSISPEALARCPLKVKIPTTMSLNLGMTVNIVMYDRMAKSQRSGQGDASVAGDPSIVIPTELCHPDRGATVAMTDGTASEPAHDKTKGPAINRRPFLTVYGRGSRI